MSASKLVKPAVEYKESFLEALDEFHAEGRYQFLDHAELEKDFETFVDDLNEGSRHLHKTFSDWAEPVPETILWLVKEDKYIGTFNIRQRLNWHLEKWGGHINFVIRPSMRGKGFGKKILHKGMPYVSYLGIDRALITLNPRNKEGIRIVEFCGGEFEDETPETDKFPSRLRYWLNCN
ncbi:MAG TPA: GNAT family N-acetyltransferase [Alphaproteobacteria bacterium]|nr:GNAT family N-acetyltransferase [Alphaproteobacteria bacterium]USO05954.1 MAG: GNAT family N-acetyltransferase [Rhodospirillales bacterium]HOO81155.1 GNAT family N-acetyltransferase [Alphaproteobacteria bacterium]